jgi:alpha-mannosidase
VSFGPTWSTHWFHLEAKIPKEWAGERVDLIWDSNSEAMIWDEKGNTLQAFTGGGDDNRRVEFTLVKACKG